MMQMNNPLLMIYGEMRRGADALTALDKVSSQYPQMFPQQTVAQARVLFGKKSGGNMTEYLQNMAQARGTTLENVVQGISAQLSNMR